MLVAERRSVGRHDIEHAETFSLLAELSLGLAGFTGVAGAFGGQARAYSHADKIRLEGIFTLTGSALLGCLTVLGFGTFGSESFEVFLYASLVGAVVLSRTAFVAATHARALALDPEVSTTRLVSSAAVVVTFASFGLLVLNAVWWREAWPLVAAFTLQLAWALFLFARLLTQRN